jgi:hypothetical protein
MTIANQVTEIVYLDIDMPRSITISKIFAYHTVDDQNPQRAHESVLLVGQFASHPKLCFTDDLQEIAPSFKDIK